MPHIRHRYLEPLLLKRLKYSPIVGIFGHRQVGKSTLISKIAKEYQTLDRGAVLTSASQNPAGFLLNRTAPFAIDECQLCPELFPELKERVRVQKRPGQFLLTGSVRFTSRKAIRESLTGRIINLELLPMNLSEMEEQPLSNLLVQALNNDFNNFRKFFDNQNNNFLKNQSKLERYLISGGLPGIAFTRDTEIRTSQFESHLDTLLERDIRLVYQTTLSKQRLLIVLKFLAENQGKPIRFMEIKRATRLSDQSLKALLNAFDALYLIRYIPVEGGGAKNGTLFFEDTGLANYLHQTYTDEQNLLRGLYANIRHSFLYRPELNTVFFQFYKHSGAYIPLCVRTKHRSLGLIPLPDATPNKSSLMCAESFIRAYPKARVLIGVTSNLIEKISDNVWVMPWAAWV